MRAAWNSCCLVNDLLVHSSISRPFQRGCFHEKFVQSVSIYVTHHEQGYNLCKKLRDGTVQLHIHR